MTTKNYLRKLKYIDNLIKAKLLEREKLMALATRRTPVLREKVSEGCTTDKIADISIKLVELDEKIDKEIDRLVDYKVEARKLIERLEDDNQKTVLSMYYVSNNTFEQIAEDMSISRQWVCKIHGWALKEIEKILV